MSAVYTSYLRALRNRNRHPIRHRMFATLALAGWLLLVIALPAHAHTTGPQLITHLDGTSPPTPGVTLKVLSTGSAPYVTVNVSGQHAFEIFGLLGEHFIRIGPEGASLNRRSPSLYLTKDPTKKPLTPPSTVDPVPDWNQVSDQATYSYYETRAEWPHIGPPVEARALGRSTTVYRFAIPASQDGQLVSITGHVSWVPAPFNLEIPLLFVPILVVGLLWLEPKAKPHMARIARGVAAVAAAAAALDGARTVLALRSGASGLAAVAPLAVVRGLVLLCAVGIPRLLRGSNRGAYGWVLAFGLYLVLFGLLRLQFPTTTPALAMWLRRGELGAGTLVSLGASLLLFLSSPRQARKRNRPAPGGTPVRRPLFG
ncbi:MAG: hypothetical protein NVSMB32_16820 [Actinomycetota bacterium]